MKAIVCSNCGAANSYEINQSSIKCDFCSNLINIPNEEKNSQSVGNSKLNENSRIKFKPTISEPKESKTDSIPYIKENYRKVRVDDGWILHFENKPSKFYRDKISYDYSNGGGELVITNKEITCFSEVFDWFTDIEFKKIRILNFNNNHINDYFSFETFENLKEISLKNNKLSRADFNFNSKFLDKINLSYNQINSVNFNTLFLPELTFTEYLTEIIIDLSNNNITDFSESNTQFIIDLLHKASKVSLNISGNSFDSSMFKSKIKNFVSNVPPSFFVNKLGAGPLTSLKNYPLKDNEIVNKFGNTVYATFQFIDENGQSTNFEIKCNNIDTFKQAYKLKYNSDLKPPSFCFIATATMGSYDHPEVMELRNFRDNWILKQQWGDRFVDWYYHYGAIAAKSIEKSFVLKKVSYLLVVKPLYILSKLITKK
ncbi:CFI-box-CTERM domain-containing protein [Flavobacterium sp.]|jgi:hypothetical protein|uniref:CFI-box-CTERM domain-containing protein n=1 Tax=Flavobacterium sp. TaxID=239 RepID=UPI0037C10DE8